jgi:hypothetical protein
MTRHCFVLIVPPELEEKLLDDLLTQFPAQAFVSTPTFGHGMRTSVLDPAEQVLGRSRAVQVQILVGSEESIRLRRRLTETFANAGLHFWILPVVDEGDIT